MSENETIAVEFKSSREFPMSLPPFIPRNRPRKRKKKYKEFKNSRTRFKEEEEEKKYSRNSKANLSQPFERWYRSRGITNTTKVSNDLKNSTRKREREREREKENQIFQILKQSRVLETIRSTPITLVISNVHSGHLKEREAAEG